MPLCGDDWAGWCGLCPSYMQPTARHGGRGKLECRQPWVQLSPWPHGSHCQAYRCLVPPLEQHGCPW